MAAAPIPPLPSSAAEQIIPLNYPIATTLNHSNFFTWKSQITPIVHGFNFTRFLEEPPQARQVPSTNGQLVDNPSFLAWDRQDQLLLGWIRSSLIETVQAQVSSCKTSYDLWNSLKQSFSATSRARLTDMKCQIQSTTKGSSSCSDYLQRIRHLADELAFISSLLYDDDLVTNVLNGLGPEYNSFVISITTSI